MAFKRRRTSFWYLLIMLLSLVMPVSAGIVLAQVTCPQYTKHLRASEEALTAMPSDSPGQRTNKRRAALRQIAYIDTVASPCSYSGVDEARTFNDWTRLLRLQAVMESLWPDLDKASLGEFIRADNYSLLLATTFEWGLHRLYRPQAWEYRGNILLNYGLWGEQNGLGRRQIAELYEDALSAYDAAGALYEALADSERYSITYLQMRGYRADVFVAMGWMPDAGCAAQGALDQATGSEPKVRKFRSDMRRTLSSVDVEGSAFNPVMCDGLGGVLSDGDPLKWWRWLALVAVLIFLAAAWWMYRGKVSTVFALL